MPQPKAKVCPSVSDFAASPVRLPAGPIRVTARCGAEIYIDGSIVPADGGRVGELRRRAGRQPVRHYETLCFDIRSASSEKTKP